MPESDILTLTPTQNKVARPLLHTKTWLSGPVGCGKTTAGAERLHQLLVNGIPAEEILVVVPQRSIAAPYYQVLNQPGIPPGGQVDILTFNGLAQRAVSLFWPLVSKSAGFGQPTKQPNFLTIETAQYYLAKIVSEKQEQEGYFALLTIDQNRLYSQLLDNLNKSALVGFDYREISKRLISAWTGESSQHRVYEQAQTCINLFRDFCLKNNLLDFSLQLEVFTKHLWPSLLCKEYLVNRYHHIIVDNLEEDTPTSHDVLREWISHFETALLISDDEGGYRRFLGADPESGRHLAETCEEHIFLAESHVIPHPLEQYVRRIGKVLNQPVPDVDNVGEVDHLADRMEFQVSHFYPQMLDWATNTVLSLVKAGTDVSRIAITSPFLPDTLRFALNQRLEANDIPTRTIRPSRSLREDPLARCLMTLAKLAHPGWELAPHVQDVAQALNLVIDGMDLLRSTHLSKIVYRKSGRGFQLTTFERISPVEQEKITFTAGKLYERLRFWLEDYQKAPVKELDIFFRRIFGELLSQPGYKFRSPTNGGETTANLIESAAKFRQNIQGITPDDVDIAREFILAVEQGLVAAQYLRSYQIGEVPAVLIAPAHTLLMQNRAFDYQIWLDIGSQGWWERLEQPLTHPYVLSRSWVMDHPWTDMDEFAVNQQTMYRVTAGLLRRCREKVFLGYVEMNEQGLAQQGELMKALQRAVLGQKVKSETNHGEVKHGG